MTFKISIPLYFIDVVVVYDPNIQEAIIRAEKKTGKRCDLKAKFFNKKEQAPALTWPLTEDRQEIYIFLTRNNHADIVHESIHASWAVAHFVGLKFHKDEEAQTYLVEYIFDEITTKLK